MFGNWTNSNVYSYYSLAHSLIFKNWIINVDYSKYLKKNLKNSLKTILKKLIYYIY